MLYLFPISSPASMWCSSILLLFMGLQRAEWQSRISIKTSLYLFPPNFGVASSMNHFYELSWALMKFYEHLAWDIAGWFFFFKGELGLCCPWLGLGFSGLSAPSSWWNLFTPPSFLFSLPSAFPFPSLFACVWWVTSHQKVEIPERQKWRCW